ncbi:Putative peptidoglycan binding domain-containing protein [Agreia bicolorata]|uniref:Putative peptidoglycan binding domain-containing protein n=1 Tax=Agreia bicolorata TaxID=110935 RepID=A0A1T4WW26_9MICO|nr:L,D-transpeptidase family protein [Agreia bicolorata]SKA81570.1 Putative peptidoglycan binding domain-containing protein [Agreia bicolorata]
MTELAPAPSAPKASIAPETSVAPDTSVVSEASAAPQTTRWVLPEPTKKKKRHLGLWIGIPAVVAVVSLVAASLVLIAPGTTVAGVNVGGMTVGAASDAVSQRLANTTLVITGLDGDTVKRGAQPGASVVNAPKEGAATELKGADLGASVDAQALAEKAHSQNPLLNVTAWNAKTAVTPTVELDEKTATAALRKVAPRLFVDPVNATMAFDAATASYVVTPAVDGTGVDLDSVRAALQDALVSGKSSVEVAATPTVVPASASTEAVTATATELNTILDSAGFYVGQERTVPIDRAVVASWITLSTNDDGTYSYTANKAAIQKIVDTLPAAVNRDAVNGVEITDTEGTTLDTISAGADGRALGDTSGVAAAYATQLAAGDPAFVLPVTVTPAQITKTSRNIVVNLSEQREYLFENGQVIDSFLISSGVPGHDSHTGSFRITAKLTSQNMGNPDLTQAPNYYTQNVPDVMYYNGDEALHGAYWHNNFGNVMSHGCINMPLDKAANVFDWAPMGTEVTVTY